MKTRFVLQFVARIILVYCFILFLTLFNFFSVYSQEIVHKPKLVLQITVDQLRGDMPTRFYDRFGQGGFKYLMTKGTYFRNAHYPYADTETGPGHATLFTGATPTQHGITAGEWWDYELGKVVYALEDEQYPILNGSGPATPGSTSSTTGRSPKNLLATTIGDELFMASEHRSKIFAVSGKDRGAILPAGRQGKAFWLSKGRFVTSSYYYSAYPLWVQDWNRKKLADRYRKIGWPLLQDTSTYWRLKRDDRPYEMKLPFLGRTMPKSFEIEDPKAYYEALSYTYVSDELVLSFSKELIDKEELGKDGVTDFLSVSFSSTDYIGHLWGPGSLEAEDNLLRVDRNLEDLLSYVDRKVGLDQTLVILAADHGMAEIPEYMQELGFSAGRVDAKMFVEQLNKQLRKTFGGTGDLVKTFLWPYLYLNTKNIDKNNLELYEVEKEAALLAQKIPGVAYATTRTDILTGNLPFNKPHIQRILNTFHPQRSGHVHLVGQQYFLLVHAPWDQFPASHGSVWSYDTFVPVIFMGPGVPVGRQVIREISPHQIAPTIAIYLGIKPPSGCVAEPLEEVFSTTPEAKEAPEETSEEAPKRKEGKKSKKKK